MFSAKGYYTIIPKLLDPSMDGREGGDGEIENGHERIIFLTSLHEKLFLFLLLI